MPSAESPRPITDPRTLRAFAHPVRSRILDELNARGPLRSADLARILDLPANQVSFHVRNLATHGLLIEAPEHARDRRDRVWQLADDGRGFSLELDASAGGAMGATAAALRRHGSARAHREVEVAYAAEREPGVLRSITQATFLLSKTEADELGKDIGAVLARWTDRSRRGEAATATPDAEGASTEGSDRRIYALLQILQPRVDDDPVPPSSDEPGGS